MTIMRLALLTGILIISVGATAPKPNQTTLLSECHLDVNERDLAFRKLKEIVFDQPLPDVDGVSYYDVSGIKPFGLVSTQFEGGLSGTFPRYYYNYNTIVKSTFENAKRVMLKNHGKASCDFSNSAEPSIKLCRISTGVPTRFSLGRRGPVYGATLTLYGSAKNVWFSCKYLPVD